MLHPSYLDLIETVNKTVGEGEEPLVQSRYSIVIASAKRARQLVAGEKPTVSMKAKPLSVAVEEMNCGNLKLSREGEVPEIVVEEKQYTQELSVEDSEEKSTIEE